MRETTVSNESALLTTEEVAARLNVHPTTLRIARSKGTLPLQWLKLGGAVRYRPEDVDELIRSNLVGRVR